MKKFLTLLLTTLLALAMCTPTQCNHTHTKECGEDGVNCTHRCECVETYDKKWPRK